MRTTTMMLLFAWGAACCGGDLDCRHKGRECAEGFECEEQGAGGWQCAPRQQAEATGEKRGLPEERRGDPAAAGFAGAGAPPLPPGAPPPSAADPLAGGPCPHHALCEGRRSECMCGPGGRLLTRTLDTDGDGKPDERAVYDSDEQGRIVQVVVDEGMDGSADSQHTYTYNERGDPVRWETYRLTAKRADAKDEVVTYVYDAGGNLTEERHDRGIDGTVDSTCRFSPPCAPPVPNPSCKPVCD